MKIKKYSYLLVFVLMLFIGLTGVYADEPEICKELITPGLRALLQEILTIPKILVPIIVIGMGILDISKAVIASKEDEMRKAQATFIKRLFIGVAIFFVPAIIDLILTITNDLLSTGTCRL